MKVMARPQRKQPALGLSAMPLHGQALALIAMALFDGMTASQLLAAANYAEGLACHSGCMSAGDMLATVHRPLSEEELAAVKSAKAEAMERGQA